MQKHSEEIESLTQKKEELKSSQASELNALDEEIKSKSFPEKSDEMIESKQKQRQHRDDAIAAAADKEAAAAQLEELEKQKNEMSNKEYNAKKKELTKKQKKAEKMEAEADHAYGLESAKESALGTQHMMKKLEFEGSEAGAELKALEEKKTKMEKTHKKELKKNESALDRAKTKHKAIESSMSEAEKTEIAAAKPVAEPVAKPVAEPSPEAKTKELALAKKKKNVADHQRALAEMEIQEAEEWNKTLGVSNSRKMMEAQEKLKMAEESQKAANEHIENANKGIITDNHAAQEAQIMEQHKVNNEIMDKHETNLYEEKRKVAREEKEAIKEKKNMFGPQTKDMDKIKEKKEINATKKAKLDKIRKDRLSAFEEESAAPTVAEPVAATVAEPVAATVAEPLAEPIPEPTSVETVKPTPTETVEPTPEPTPEVPPSKEPAERPATTDAKETTEPPPEAAEAAEGAQAAEAAKPATMTAKARGKAMEMKEKMQQRIRELSERQTEQLSKGAAKEKLSTQELATQELATQEKPSVKETLLEKGKKYAEESLEKDVRDSSAEQAAEKKLKEALILYNKEDVSNQEKIKTLKHALKFASTTRHDATLFNKVKKALNYLTETSQSGGSKINVELDNILDKVLVKTNKQIEEHIKEHDKVDHPNFPEYTLLLTSEELDKSGMFYTDCYEDDKLCKDKVKKHFEDVIKSIENKEKRQEEQKKTPKHSFHQKKFAQLDVVFEKLSTKQHQIEMHDIMIELFIALKERKSKDIIINLLTKGIRRGSIMGVKLLHTYQALHNIDIKGDLKPNDEKDYLDTMMSIIFSPMCPFIELAKMLNMKEDINNDFYTLMYNNKTLVITIIHNHYNVHNNSNTSSKEKEIDIARESVRKHKELMKSFQNDPINKKLEDGIIDSLYDEFKQTNSKLCDPWKFLTQDVEIDIEILLLHCKKSHKIGLLSKQQNDIALAFKHAIDIFDAVMSHTKEDQGIWCGYLNSFKQFVDMEKKQQKVIFMKVIEGYKSNTNLTTLKKSLKATTTEEKAAIQLEKKTLHFLKQVKHLLNFDDISDSLEYDYSVFILERLLNYMGNHINSIFEKLLKLGTIEGKHDDGIYHTKLNTTKEYINGYLLEMNTLSKNIRFRYSLYRKLHPIRDNEDELKKFVSITHNEEYKQKGGSSTIENQLKQQLENAKLRLHEIEKEEHKLRQMRGGIRKSRQFTRKQRGGNLSSSLKQYAHKTSENQKHHEELKDFNIKAKEGGEVNKNTVEHFSKIQQLESELNTNKFKNYKQMENTYKQLVQLKQKELKQAGNSCLHKQLMHKVKNLSCEKDCLRQLQTDPKNNKIQCGCKSMPKPFNYKNC